MAGHTHKDPMFIDVFNLMRGDAYHGDRRSTCGDRVVLGSLNPYYIVTGPPVRTRGPVSHNHFVSADMLGVPVQYDDGSHGVRYFDLDTTIYIRRPDAEAV